MTPTLLVVITTLVVAATVASALALRIKRINDRLVELKCEFCLSDAFDEMLDNYKSQTGVEIDGILGNDFMVANDYIIDYESLVVRHKSVRISIKDTMNILELPLIVLWQNRRKFIFLLDTGATNSVIHTNTTKDKIEYVATDETSVVYGVGGKVSSNSSIKSSLYYYIDGKPKSNTK